jgi:heme exporter protein C
MVWKILLFLLMIWVIVAAFVTVAPQQIIGDASRIFYFHVPQAMVAVLAFVISMIASINYLRKGRPVDDDRARLAAGLGLLFSILATVTGSIFAKVTWQSFWNWDPRQTSILILLLIYGAYFALRSAVDGEDRRARLAAVYAIFAFITVPFLVFVIPRVLPSLHPTDSIVDSSGKLTLSGITLMIFLSANVAFTGLFIWIYRVSLKLAALERKLNEEAEK